MSSLIDKARAVREGEELNIPKLEAYLTASIPGSKGPLVVEQFPGGYSNLTYLLKLGDQEMVLRRPPFGNQVKSAHDMGREYRVLSKLSAVYPPAPKPLAYCTDAEILGADFYVMERRRGIILRKQPPEGLDLSPPIARKLSESLADNLAALHAVDYEAAGLADLGKPEGFVERQVAGWSKRYDGARTDDVPEMHQAAEWLAANMPKHSGASLIHNDFKHDNLVLDPNDITHVVAVLDWEMATIGDPLIDVGTTLAYWVEEKDPPGVKAFGFGPTTLPGSLTRAEFLDRYAKTSGRNVSDMLFYFVFGLFKLAVIIQQIYARYHRGHTKDPRFAHLNLMVAVLAQQATAAIESGKF
ncbi:MAG: phosphotransferase family protein [Planctomycetota bacterium]